MNTDGLQHFWHPEDHIAIRGIVNNRVWEAMSVVVVKDSADETILLLGPGAECAWPDTSRERRWDATRNNRWVLNLAPWGSTWFLIFLEPQKYYATYATYNEAGHFEGYYVNFQLPYHRSHCGFDSLDLELDLVIDEQFEYTWKDEADYQVGIEAGFIRTEWMQEIDDAKQDILHKLNQRVYPFDGSWLGWAPDPNWIAPQLPLNWDDVVSVDNVDRSKPITR